MKLVSEGGLLFIEHDGRRISLSQVEVDLFRQMTPLGRKMLLRKRALDIRYSRPEEAELILELFHLPAREWSFRITESSSYHPDIPQTSI